MCCSRPDAGGGKRPNCRPCPVPGAAGATGAAGGPDPGAAGGAAGAAGPATRFNAASRRNLDSKNAAERAAQPVIPVGPAANLSSAHQHAVSSLLGPYIPEDSKGALVVAGRGGPFDANEMRLDSWLSEVSSVRKSLEEELKNITPEHLILRAERLGVQ